jgi:PAS domain S-box-containing protein
VELKQFKRTLQQAMVMPIAACMFLAGVLAWQIRQSSATVDLIEKADLRIALATRIELLVVDEETGLRGYQTTSDPRFLQPYYAAQQPIQQAVDTLMNIKTAQALHLKAFIQLHETWHTSFIDPLITMIRTGAHTNDVDLNLTGKTSMDSMRNELNEIIIASEQRRADNIAQWNRSKRDEIAILVFLALSIGLIIALFIRDRLEEVSAAFLRSLDLQRRRTEELFQSEQNLRTTLTSIGDGVITCDVDSNIAIINPVAQELTGWSEAEALKQPLEEVFHIVNETSREPVENPVSKVRRLNRVVGLANHTVLIRKDGSEISIDDSGSPILNEAGQLTGVVMVFRDVSMERRTRAALLANEKLAVAGRLAATIAHEIHNPLDSVANLLYLLQQDPNGAESKHFLDIAQSELSRVTQISRAMLSLYRESKAPVPVNLKDMIDDLLLLMEGRFNMIGVTVSTELPPKIVVEGFPAELRQVFTNLITNAAEAAGSGGHIKVRVTAQDAGIDRSGEKLHAGAIVEIIDNGPGIPLEIRDSLFQPFFTTKGERGTGLGLWVTQGIIRKHAGSIRLDSRTEEEVHGTTARVFLASSPIIDRGGD